MAGIYFGAVGCIGGGGVDVEYEETGGGVKDGEDDEEARLIKYHVSREKEFDYLDHQCTIDDNLQ